MCLFLFGKKLRSEHFSREYELSASDAGFAPYRADLILIGGWAHRLSRLHDLSQPLDFEALGTQDVDVAIPAKVPPQEDDLGKLYVRPDSRNVFLGEENPPVTHYQFGRRQLSMQNFLHRLSFAEGGDERDRRRISPGSPLSGHFND